VISVRTLDSRSLLCLDCRMSRLLSVVKGLGRVGETVPVLQGHKGSCGVVR
jgi:hypothetical protein